MQDQSPDEPKVDPKARSIAAVLIEEFLNSTKNGDTMSSSDGGDGKRSWRSAEGGAGGGAGKGPSPDRPRRFRGGSAGSRVDQKQPVWFRLFVPIVALVVIAAGIGVLFWMLRLGATRPLLVAWAVTDYESPEIPLNQFAYRDVQKILRSTSFALGNSRSEVAADNLQTRGGFENFFGGTVPRLQEDTVVVYLSAHGISRSDGGYILLSESTSDLQTQYPVRRVLEQMAQCPARRKLLILDATRIPSRLALGLLGNDFVENVKADFQAVTKNLPESNSFWVFLSSDAGQSSWASRSVGHSIFGITMAYALRGGIAVDAANDRGRTDGYLSVQEITDYVQKRVASWAPRFRDGAIQKPLCLTHGPDFRLIRADDRLTEEQLLKEATTESKKVDDQAAGAAKKDEGKQDDSAAKGPAKGEEPKPEAKEKPAEAAIPEEWTKALKSLDESAKPVLAAMAALPGDPKAVITDEQLLDAIMAFWRFRDQLTAKPEFLRRRPHEIHAFEQSILRAERFFLAKQLADVGRMIDESLIREAHALVRPFTIAEVKPNWSIAFLNPEMKEDPLAAAATTIKTLREDPADKNREPVAKLPVAEARLLSMLASDFTQSEKWLDAEVVTLAIQVRTTAERAARLVDPRLLPLVKAELRTADQNRRLGERNLFLRRVSAARQQLQQANAQYENVERLTKQLDNSLRTIEQTVGNAVFYIRWLGEDLADREGRAEDVRLFEKVLSDVKSIDLSSSNAASQIEALANQCSRLESKALDYAERSWQRTSWRQTHASLELVFLPAPRREQLLKWLLSYKEETPFTYDARAKAADPIVGPANLFPLVGFVSLLGGSNELKADLSKLGPLQGSDFNTETMLNDSAARGIRAAAGERVHETIVQAVTEPINKEIDDSSPAKVWNSEIHCRLLAPLRAPAGSEAATDDAFFEQIDRRYLNAWLRWEVDRLIADDSNVPKGWYRPVVNLAVNELRKAEPSYREGVPPRYVQVNGSDELTVPATGTLSQTLSIEVPQDPTNRAKKLVFDWYGDKDRLGATAAKTKGADGRLEVDVPADIGGKPWQLPIELVRVGDNYNAPLFRAWLEREDGSVEWLKLSVRFATPEIKPAELMLSWAERGGESDVIEVYPNQQMALKIAIKKNAPAPLPLRVEISSGDTLPLKILAQLPENMIGEHPLTLIDPRSELKIESDEEGFELSIRLFKESSLLDERKLRINVLDVQRVFDVDVAIDKDQGEAVFRVRRVETADSSAAIPLALSFGEVAGRVDAIAKIDDGVAEGTLRAPIPADAPKPIVANLSVAGVPRAFRYAINLDPPSARLITRPSLRIVTPANNALYQFDIKRQSLPVTLAVDGIVAENYRDSQLRLGVVSQRETSLGPQNAIANVMGRSLSLRLVLEKDAKGSPIYLSNSMSDVTLDLDAPWKMGRQTIRAELALSSQVLVATSNVYFLREAPRVRLDQPAEGATIPLGRSIRAVVTPADADGEVIDSVEFYLDKNTNGKRDDDEVIVPIGASADGSVRFNGDGKPATVELPTDGLKAGKFFVICRPRIKFVQELPATEPVVRFGPEIRRQIEITETKPKEEMKPQTGTIVGVAKVGPQPAARVKVTIAGVGETTTDASGQFRFDKVPPGKYMAVGAISQPYQREGQAMLEVVAGKEASVEIELRLKQSPATP